MFELLAVITSSGAWKGIAAFAQALAILLGAPGPYQVLRIGDASAEPQLHEGDLVLARLDRPGFAELRSGDLIVWNAQRRGGLLIRRIVGLPGDTVSMTKGALSIDGKPAATEPVGPAGARLRRETLPGGRSYAILGSHATSGPLATLAPTKVIARCAIVLSDNREATPDSRTPLPDTMGFVCRDAIMGKPLLVLWSADMERVGAVR